MLFLSVRGFLDYAGPNSHSRSNAAAVLPSSSSEWSRHPDLPPFRNSITRPTKPLSTLRLAPRDATRKTRGQDGFATSFPAGILPPLQHAVYPGALRIGGYSGAIAACIRPQVSLFGEEADAGPRAR